METKGNTGNKELKAIVSQEDFEKYLKIVENEMTYYSLGDEANKLHTQMIINCCSGDPDAKTYVKRQIFQILRDNKVNDEQKLNYLAKEIFNEKYGLSILEELDEDRDITDIDVFGVNVTYRKYGINYDFYKKFNSNEHALEVIKRALEFEKRTPLSDINTAVRSRRLNGDRITAAIPPSTDIPEMAIRRKTFYPSMDKQVKARTLPKEAAKELELLIKGRKNISIQGPQNSGKSTLLMSAIEYMDDNHIIGFLEEHFENEPRKIYPNKKFRHFQSTERRTMKDQFKILLSMDIDRFLVGESLSTEMEEVIKAGTRGQKGFLTTAHITNPYDTVDEFAVMVEEDGKARDPKALRFRVARALELIVQMGYMYDNSEVVKKKLFRVKGIYETRVNRENFTYEIVPIWEFDEDEKILKKVGSYSDEFIKDIRYHGLSKEEIEKLMRKH